MRIYFQIQGDNSPTENYHSDGCMPYEGIDRKFLHDQLDEFLNKIPNSAPEESGGEILNGPHFIVCRCIAHKD